MDPGGVAYRIPLDNRIYATFFFMLATATRSNGSLLFIFPLCLTANKLFHAKSKKELSLNLLLNEAALLFYTGILQALPIFGVLLYGNILYCNDTPSPYCTSIMPNIYAYVQEKYWNVGLFKYWELKQIPNFALAFPIIFISVKAIWTYLNSDFIRFFTCGAQCKKIGKSFAENPLVMPFVAYWAVNFVILVFVANVQIITRMLCSLPAVYWFICDGFSIRYQWVIGYSLVYLCVGTMLFSNFYPWT